MEQQNIKNPYQLSLELGIKSNIVNNWFTREKIPVDWILPVAKILGTSTDFLLDSSVSYINNTKSKGATTSLQKDVS